MRRLGVSQRVMGSALLSVLVALVLLILTVNFMRFFVRDAVMRQVGRDADQVACEADPVSFGRSESFGFSIYAYNLQGQSQNPEAPPIRGRDLARLGGLDSLVHLTESDEEGREATLIRTAESGACAVLRITARPPVDRLAWTLSALLIGGTLAAMLLAGLGSFLFVVRPMQRRIVEIAASARGVGESGFQPAPAQLEDGLGKIAGVLEESHERIVSDRAELLRRHTALEEHLAGIAHDLRTPLSSMQLSLEALVSENPEDEGPRHALADVVYLSALVENLHQGVRLRHGLALDQGQVDLCALVERLGSRFEIIGRHAGVALAVNLPEQPVWVDGSPALTERALANLVQNAVGHNRPGGHVAVVLTIQDGAFDLQVLDDGPGLPPALLHSLQNPSFSEDPVRQRGPGLGMLITQEIAGRMGWSLEYQALQPQGLQVRLQGATRGPHTAA